MDDRLWMYHRVCEGFVTQEFYDGVRRFVNFAFSQALPERVVRCPCVKCDNRKFQNKEVVIAHLLQKGFTPQYSRWIYHGEMDIEETSTSGSLNNNNVNDVNPYREMIMDAIGESNIHPNEEYDYINEEAPNFEAKKFFDMLRAVNEPLYSGCKTETVLSACVNMMVLKAQTRLTHAGFNYASSMIKNFLPEDNKLTANYVFVFAQQCQQIYLLSKPGCESNEWVTVIKTVARSRFASDVLSPTTMEDSLDVDQVDEICQPSIVSIDDNSNQPFIMEHFDAVDDDELERVMRPNDVYHSGSDDDENAYDVEVDYDEDADLDDEDEGGDQDKNINDEDTEDEFAL